MSGAADCEASLCGNGALDEGEACDDGNREDGDGCGDCSQSACGDSLCILGETLRFVPLIVAVPVSQNPHDGENLSAVAPTEIGSHQLNV